MKIDLTTGTWQGNPGCPINITLVSTSDGGYHHQIGRIHRSHVVGGEHGSAMVVMFVDCCVGGGWYFLYYSYHGNPTGREFLFPPEPYSS
jgi:hypothetical protein